jgi:hypothetical protein
MKGSTGGTYLSVSPMAARWWGEIIAARRRGWTIPGDDADADISALTAPLAGPEPPADLEPLPSAPGGPAIRA